ncbi:hypothetical protein K457DRAFT_12512 [Linnemannia elongata AG-77]|uniref:Uncharacterized protein n=1 Tax=Linnemannia elongata AG-77 TaxID=1314771 RepID=A0A197KJW2_9FUNG|nr:hypothetical protein K457DRAFT_12512 [Linnemannia elongata AG-77]
MAAVKNNQPKPKFSLAIRDIRHAPVVQSLVVTLDWDFGSANLVTLVDMVSKSKVKFIKLDLQDDQTSNATIESLRPGKGCYHSLLGLLSNSKLHSLQFLNLYLLGTRTSNLPSSFSAPWLQSFFFHGRINEEDQSRLINIISRCSQLVDLRLVPEDWCSMDLSLQQAVFSLKMLRRLHLRGWDLCLHQDRNLNDRRPMKEIVYYTALEDARVLTKTIRRSGLVLEILVLYFYAGTVVDICPGDPTPIPLPGESEGTPAESLSNAPHLSALTHLDLSMPLTDSSLKYLSNILPRLYFVHFGCNVHLHRLLLHCNLASLKSLSSNDANGTDLNLLLETMGEETYYSSAEQVVANRINEFTESLVIRLDEFLSTKYVEGGGKPRTAVGSSKTLPSHRLTNIGSIGAKNHHYRFLQHHVLEIPKKTQVLQSIHQLYILGAISQYHIVSANAAVQSTFFQNGRSS